jgi:hypothetical protein
MPKDLWYAEDEVPAGYGLEDLLAELFPKLHHRFWWQKEQK